MTRNPIPTIILIILIVLSINPLIHAQTNDSTHQTLIILWQKQLGYEVWGVAWSPDGTKIAAGTSYGKIYLLDTEDGAIILEKEVDELMYKVTWSPDSTKIAAGTGYPSPYYGKVYVFDIHGNIIWEKQLESPAKSIAWSPDGTKIAVGIEYPDNKVYVLDAGDGTILWERELDAWVLAVAWSPDGSMLAAGTGHGTVYVFDINGNMLWEKQLESCEVWSISWSPDGTQIAVGTAGIDYPDKVYVFDINGNILWEKELESNVLAVAWSPDGSKIAAGTSLGWKVYILDATNGYILWEKKLRGLVYSVDWNPDGTKIAAGTAYGDVVVLIFTPIANILGKSVIVISDVSSNSSRISVENASALVEFTSTLRVRKVLVNVSGEWRPGYLIENNITILRVSGNVEALRVIYNISKNVAYSVNQIIMPEYAVIVKPDPVIALDIRNPQEGETYSQRIIVVTYASESEFLSGLEVSYKVIPSEFEATITTTYTDDDISEKDVENPASIEDQDTGDNTTYIAVLGALVLLTVLGVATLILKLR